MRGAASAPRRRPRARGELHVGAVVGRAVVDGHAIGRPAQPARDGGRAVGRARRAPAVPRRRAVGDAHPVRPRAHAVGASRARARAVAHLVPLLRAGPRGMQRAVREGRGRWQGRAHGRAACAARGRGKRRVARVRARGGLPLGGHQHELLVGLTVRRPYLDDGAHGALVAIDVQHVGGAVERADGDHGVTRAVDGLRAHLRDLPVLVGAVLERVHDAARAVPCPAAVHVEALARLGVLYRVVAALVPERPLLGVAAVARPEEHGGRVGHAVPLHVHGHGHVEHGQHLVGAVGDCHQMAPNLARSMR